MPKAHAVGPAQSTVASERVGSVRSFNRFYTAFSGLLHGGLLETAYSLTEARLLFELAQRETSESAELRERLGIDGGYFSRLVSRLEKQGLVRRSRSSTDRRRQRLSLTAAGREAFQVLDGRAEDEAAGLLAELSDDEQSRLVDAMRTIRELLGDAPPQQLIVLREPQPGELGWVVHRHGALYAAEYGWDQGFEALVGKIVAEYMERGERERERAWIAEQGGRPVGCVLCTRRSDATAQLRLLLVEPSARGQGIGSRLVAECLDFARRSGYRRITLWTNGNLIEARRIYERAGFELDEENPHHSFGVDLVGQTWSREL